MEPSPQQCKGHKAKQLNPLGPSIAGEDLIQVQAMVLAAMNVDEVTLRVLHAGEVRDVSLSGGTLGELMGMVIPDVRADSR